MPFYGAERENYTPSTTNVDIAVTAASTSIDRIAEVLISGTATSSAVNRQGLVRHTVNGTTPSAITLTKQNPQSGSAAASAASSFTGAPTFASQNATNFALNAFGGIVRWVAAPGEEFYLVGAAGAGSQEGSLTAKNGAGGGTQSAHVLFEEL